jgi:hypothetical protein
MGLRSRRATLNEGLLAKGPRGAEPEDAATLAERGAAKSRITRLVVGLAAFLVLLGLKFGIEFLPSWVGLIVGLLVVAHLVSIFVGSTKRGTADAGKRLRALFFLWLAICFAATVLIALGGFQEDDRALLGVLWPILALIWVAYRLRSAASPQPGMGSRAHSP